MNLCHTVYQTYLQSISCFTSFYCFQLWHTFSPCRDWLRCELRLKTPIDERNATWTILNRPCSIEIFRSQCWLHKQAHEAWKRKPVASATSTISKHTTQPSRGQFFPPFFSRNKNILFLTCAWVSKPGCSGEAWELWELWERSSIHSAFHRALVASRGRRSMDLPGAVVDEEVMLSWSDSDDDISKKISVSYRTMMLCESVWANCEADIASYCCYTHYKCYNTFIFKHHVTFCHFYFLRLWSSGRCHGVFACSVWGTTARVHQKKKVKFISRLQRVSWLNSFLASVTVLLVIRCGTVLNCWILARCAAAKQIFISFFAHAF